MSGAMQQDRVLQRQAFPISKLDLTVYDGCGGLLPKQRLLSRGDHATRRPRARKAF